MEGAQVQKGRLESWLANGRPTRGKAWSFAHSRGVQGVPQTKEGLGISRGVSTAGSFDILQGASPVCWRGKLPHTSDAIGSERR